MKEDSHGELVEWNVGEPNENVTDIEIIVFEDDMKTPRRYEKQFGWKEEWTEAKNKNLKIQTKEYKDFIKKWPNLEAKRKVPIWYKFDPVNAKFDSQAHNSMKSVKEWEVMYNFLKGEKWLERDAKQTEDNRNQYTEKSQFVVDCRQLLGIGGEAVVIRKDVAEKVNKDKDKVEDRKYEALKIIPMMKHNFESEKLEEMKKRVEDRHDRADPEFNEERIRRENRRKMQSENQHRKGERLQRFIGIEGAFHHCKNTTI